MTCSPCLISSLSAGVAVLTLGFASAAEAREQRWLTIGGAYKGDLIAYKDGDHGWRGDALDLLSIVATLDLQRLQPGLTARLHVENSSGGEPAADLGLARGFDNSEAPRQRLRLYEAWLQQSLAGERASVLVGFYDFNSEFYATASSSLFLGPGFGIGTELSATGPGGPSIYPSTGLTLRLRSRLGEAGYLQAAAINADVGVPGDPGGPDFTFSQGVLLAAEAGREYAEGRIAFGAWSYSQPADPERSDDRSHGLYVLAERQLGGEGAPATAFLRAGLSDGRTTDFSGGIQAGVTVTPAFAARPDSAFGVAFDHAAFSPDARRALGAESVNPSRGETGIEITYADRLAGRVLLQPDLQFVFDPGGDRDRSIVTVFTLRFTVEL